MFDMHMQACENAGVVQRSEGKVVHDSSARRFGGGPFGHTSLLTLTLTLNTSNSPSSILRFLSAHSRRTATRKILNNFTNPQTSQFVYKQNLSLKATTMADDEGASPKEQLIEACRRNNTSLLNDLFTSPPLSSDPKSIANFLNSTTDPLGSGALHIAAKYGSYEVLDVILDQEMVEIDGREKRDGDTCLHVAVRYCNGLEKGEWEHGRAVVDILVDAGCDPR